MMPYRLHVSRRFAAAVVVIAAFATACLGGGRATSEGTSTTGEASYYADKFVGRETASGDVYDPDEMTAAHPTLPFGTRVRVTRLGNGGKPSVMVRINDRGPFKDSRIIDLSRAAARELGMLAEGVVPVRITVVERPDDGGGNSGSAASGRGW